MARFEGEAAHSPERMRSVARILSKGALTDSITPTERAQAVEAINFSLMASENVTKFLGDAPADDIIKCGCAGCEHLKSHLANLRRIAHR